MKGYLRQIIFLWTSFFLFSTLCMTANAAANGGKALDAIFLLLLNNSRSALINTPVYEDPANLPELPADSYGAMGGHPVKVLSINNPGYQDNIVNQKAGEQYAYYTSSEATIRLKVDLYYPADNSSTRPTVFFISGYQHYHSEQFRSLLYFIASHGYNAVFVSYQDMRAEEANHIKEILENVVDNPLFAGKIDTTRVGFMGHSLGGGLLFHLIQQLPAWGRMAALSLPLQAGQPSTRTQNHTTCRQTPG